jgi:N6-adenosine-specific RNA methylase IME4
MKIEDYLVRIKPAFKSLIPPLSQDERCQLEENIAREGCRDPLVVWDLRQPDSGYCPECEKKTDWRAGSSRTECEQCDYGVAPQSEVVLLDGHNRHEICERLGLPYKLKALKFGSEEEASDWIDANQLGRRNLSPDAASLLRGRRYNRAKKAQGGTGANQHKQQKAQSEPTADRLSKQHGVSRETIKRDGKFAAAVDRLSSVSPDLGNQVVSGNAPPKKEVIQAAELLEKAPEKAKEIFNSGKTFVQIRREIKEEAKEHRRAENAAKVAVTPVIGSTADVKFATIVIDPPWDWGDEGDVDQLGRARPGYATMSLEKLLEFPIPKLSDTDCHLYLWITNRSLPKGFALLERWGFRYVTCLTWCKPSFGMGNYFRGSTEQVLFAVRGSQGLKRKDCGTWFQAPRGPDGHSSKPDEFYTIVESCSPGPFLDVFSRRQRNGWTAWGAEVSQ